jgi:MFS family permease
MALPFFVVAATGAGLGVTDVGLLLGAQTAGSLVSNALWGNIGDRHGKLVLLQTVAWLRLAVPLAAIVILVFAAGYSRTEIIIVFVALFAVIGMLVNGMTIGYLGYLMEISPDDRRPAYSSYFNTLASPAALLPLVGAAIADVLALEAVFAAASATALLQLVLYFRLSRLEQP